MRAVVQRVSQAAVIVREEETARPIGSISAGFLVLLGIASEDTEADALALAEKIAHLRVFEDGDGKLNLSLLDTGGSALVVSNFTLLGDCRKGRRPSFIGAASGPQAETLYRSFGQALTARGVPVQYGEFGARMEVSLVNAGPITLMLDSRRLF